jgi:hypothetical protein
MRLDAIVVAELCKGRNWRRIRRERSAKAVSFSVSIVMEKGGSACASFFSARDSACSAGRPAFINAPNLQKQLNDVF